MSAPVAHPTVLPTPSRSRPVIAPPASGPGHWAGAPSAVVDGGAVYLAYRLRRPVGDGRGHAVVVARSADGLAFETLAVLERDSFGAASLERPCLVRVPAGGWRIYVSCATPGSDHWWVDAIDAADPGRFDAARRRPVFAGDETTAVKDPVVVVGRDGWQAWVCCHPLDDPARTDRMSTRRATSADGLDWVIGPTVLTGTAGSWDERGARMTSVLPGRGGWALYDGRASAAENWEERTGLAVFDGRSYRPLAGPVGSAAGPGGLRYADVVALPGGGHRLYYEMTRADGTHEICTELVG